MNHEEKLKTEILADAERRAERLISRAKRDADKAVKMAQAELDSQRERDLAAAQVQADERVRAIAASVTQESKRRWLVRREEILDDLFARALADAEKGCGIDPEGSLRALALEALKAVGPSDAVLLVPSGAAHWFDTDRLRDLRSEAFGDGVESVLTVREEPALAGGVIVTSADGVKSFDNTLRTRLERLRGELRMAITAGIDL